MIVDGDSYIKRMNVGTAYEIYMNATADQVRRDVLDLLSKGDLSGAWGHLHRFYHVASPKFGEVVDDIIGTDQVKIQNHLEYLKTHPISLWLPPDTPGIGRPLMTRVAEEFPLRYGPVTYRGKSGKLRTTKLPMIMGSMYSFLLEKTGGEWAAVASAKRQHFGLLAKLTQTDKYSLPWREQPVRFLGESEARLLAAYAGPKITADLLEIPNDPAACRTMIRNVLTAERPTDIPQIIDRTVVPRGGSRSVKYVTHLLECAGIEFTRD